MEDRPKFAFVGNRHMAFWALNIYFPQWECMNYGALQKEYEQMLRMIGPEFEILRTVPLEEIRQKSGFLIAEGIERLRNGEVERIPGFDGEYGTIKLFQPYELEEVDRQR